MNTNRTDSSKQVQVPNLVDVELVAASNQLAQLGLVASPDMTGVDTGHSGPLKVGAQEPAPGQWLEPGGPVILKALSPTV